MPGFTVSPRNVMLDWLTGVANPPAVATRYITTFLGDPQVSGIENILTLSGSANRILITPIMGAAVSAVAASTANVVFTNSAIAVTVVDYVAIYDAITGGNLLASGQVQQRTVAVGDSLSIVAGILTVGIT